MCIKKVKKKKKIYRAHSSSDLEL